MNKVKFVPPTKERIESYWETFRCIAREKKYLATTEAFPLETTKAFIQNTIDKHIPYLLVIDEVTDEVVGWCDVQPITLKRGFLGIGLLEGYREQGIGKQLIQSIFILCKEYGYKWVELHVRHTNERAIHVYKTLGFEVVSYKKEALKLEEMVEDIIVMQLKIKVVDS